MRKCLILVDNSNLFIGGQQLSAEQHDERTGHHHRRHGDHPRLDHHWRLDFEHLLKRLANGREIHHAFMVGSQPEDREGPWDAARECGFEVIVYERDPGRGEKCADTELVVRGTEIIATAAVPMTLVIASGDRDMVPLVEVAHRHGWHVELCAFTNSYSEGGELAQCVDSVRPLDDYVFDVGFRDAA